MTDTLLLWFQNYCKDIQNAGAFLVSKPFSNVVGLDSNIANLTPLALIGIGGLVSFIVVAIVKWVIS